MTDQKKKTPKTVDQLSPEELEARRKYDRERKATKRAEEKQVQEKAEAQEFSSVFEQYFASPEYREVAKYVFDTLEKIYQELQMEPLSTFHYVAEHMEIALTLHYALDKNLQRQTDKGPFFGGHYPDVAGQDIVRARHQLDLTRSETFSDIYWDLLRKLDKMYSDNITSMDLVYKANAQAIKDELSGTYIYPVPTPVVKLEPKVDIPAAPEPDNLENILAAKKKQLEEDIARYSQINRFIGPDALKYLDGGFR